MPAPDDVPDIRWARNGEVHLAYQQWGDGDVALVSIPGIVSNIEVMWEQADAQHYFGRLGAFCRNVIYDKRGQGLSDREAGVPTMDDRLADTAAVMDAAGVERAAMAGISEGGTTAAMFAATFPERVSHLLLFDTFATVDAELADPFVTLWAERWGSEESLTVDIATPSKAHDPEFRRWMRKFERSSTTPGGLLALWRWVREIDVTPVLSSIQCPTLVIHRRDDRLVPVALGRALAEQIPGARLLELPGGDHFPSIGDSEPVLVAIEEFLTGHEAVSDLSERVLATVVFTDIVESTDMAARVGDSAWRRLLDAHDAAVEREVRTHNGTLVKSTGDGTLVTFDAPGKALRFAHRLRSVLEPTGLGVRVGVHTGEVERRGDDVGGIAVHIAARVEAAAGRGEVLASRTVKDLVAGSGFHFESRGTHRLKGVPEEWELYAVGA
jgi:pimeloyl-ACP methyl ester carboxylesterase/class 3 adenylate cyclase